MCHGQLGLVEGTLCDEEYGYNDQHLFTDTLALVASGFIATGRINGSQMNGKFQPGMTRKIGPSET